MWSHLSCYILSFSHFDRFKYIKTAAVAAENIKLFWLFVIREAKEMKTKKKNLQSYGWLIASHCEPFIIRYLESFQMLLFVRFFFLFFFFCFFFFRIYLCFTEYVWKMKKHFLGSRSTCVKTHKWKRWKFIDDISDLTIFFNLSDMVKMLQQWFSFARLISKRDYKLKETTHKSNYSCTLFAPKAKKFKAYVWTNINPLTIWQFERFRIWNFSSRTHRVNMSITIDM